MDTKPPKTFKVPDNQGEFKFTEKGSKFLGWASFAGTEEEARLLLAGRCDRHHDATHNCWAWRVGEPESPVERSSDDGEPSGTAGKPILNAIKGAGLVHIIVVVTRWFGGTKLGKGGLIRSYGFCAAETLKLLAVKEVVAKTTLGIKCPYDLIGWVEKIVSRFGGSIEKAEYSDIAILTIAIPTELVQEFEAVVFNDGGGKVEKWNNPIKYT